MNTKPMTHSFTQLCRDGHIKSIEGGVPVDAWSVVCGGGFLFDGVFHTTDDRVPKYTEALERIRSEADRS
jgi:hypothetical protein